eukprot:3080105-Rhodomonas_salina.1
MLVPNTAHTIRHVGTARSAHHALSQYRVSHLLLREGARLCARNGGLVLRKGSLRWRKGGLQWRKGGLGPVEGKTPPDPDPLS